MLLSVSNFRMILSQDSKEPGKDGKAKCASDLSEEERDDKFQSNKKEIQNVKLQLKISNEVLQLG